MRNELEFPIIDESKIEYVGTLIDIIAEGNIKDCSNELEELNHITSKEYDGSEFIEYWGWTSLDIISRKALTPNPPYIKDLSQSDIIEIVSIIKKYLCEVDDVKADYYIELLHKNLPICDVLDYVLREDTPEKIANELLMNSKNNIIFL